MDSSDRGLGPLQRDLLREFFARATGYELAGGGALVGFHLHHRMSQDLDLFTRPPADLAEGRRALEAAASALAASTEPVSTWPDFQRVMVRRGDEATVVDLVVDRAPPVDPVTIDFGGVAVQPLREIAAGKVCALLGRCEVRDLVDLHAMAGSGVDLEQAVTDAARKDAGVSPATLAWLLDQMRIGPEAVIPGGIAAPELERFRVELVRKLRAMAWPG